MANLVKTETIMTVQNTGPTNVTFGYPLDEQPQRFLTLDNVTWQDLGFPDVITVTVEPGDRLNEV